LYIDLTKNESQALDLSESEDEIELEDLRQHFVLSGDDDDVSTSGVSNKLFTESFKAMLGSDTGQIYLFQFPEDFPDFEVSKDPQTSDEQTQSTSKKRSVSPSKRVSFAEDTKTASTSKDSSKEADAKEEESKEGGSNDDKPSGIIGHLEILQSGAVRMRFSNGHVFDVRARYLRPLILFLINMISSDLCCHTTLFSTTSRCAGRS
jgi:DNA-directed RNA polymerase III subunit RPC4